jgi:hypothetical protein
VQKWTDYAARVQGDHKGVLYSFATILPCGGPAFIKETERALSVRVPNRKQRRPEL